MQAGQAGIATTPTTVGALVFTPMIQLGNRVLDGQQIYAWHTPPTGLAQVWDRQGNSIELTKEGRETFTAWRNRIASQGTLYRSRAAKGEGNTGANTVPQFLETATYYGFHREAIRGIGPIPNEKSGRRIALTGPGLPNYLDVNSEGDLSNLRNYCASMTAHGFMVSTGTGTGGGEGGGEPTPTEPKRATSRTTRKTRAKGKSHHKAKRAEEQAATANA